MAWNLSGEFIETCSCNMLCPCWFGQADLMLMDQGYCATSILIRIREGNHEGTDLSGLNAVVNLHFPGPTLFDGDGTGRLHIEDTVSDEQQAALETILQGASGGGMEVPASLLSSWLPTRRSAISVTENDGSIEATIPGAGTMTSTRLVNELGNKMTLSNTVFSMAFKFDDHVGDLAPSAGTSWQDPDMPTQWEGRSGVVGQVKWDG